MLAVRARHVFRQRRVFSFDVAAYVRSHTGALEQALHRRVGQAHPDVLAHQRVRHAVVMPVGLHVIVNTGFGFHPRCILVAAPRERLHRRSIDRGERLRAASRQLLEGTMIQIHQQLRDRRVQLVQREELSIAKTREDPPLHDEHAHLHRGFVFWLVRPRR